MQSIENLVDALNTLDTVVDELLESGLNILNVTLKGRPVVELSVIGFLSTFKQNDYGVEAGSWGITLSQSVKGIHFFTVTDIRTIETHRHIYAYLYKEQYERIIEIYKKENAADLRFWNMLQGGV